MEDEDQLWELVEDVVEAIPYRPVRTTEEHSYQSMLTRCYNPRRKYFEHYGGRGIKVCDRWLRGTLSQTGYACFLTDLGRKPNKKYTLDRINNDGNYEPSNCKWSTRSEQMRNTSRSVNLTHNGLTKTIAEWAEHLQIPVYTVHSRHKRGFQIKDILYVGKHTSGRRLTRVSNEL